tara:strand:+ start:3692 stop:4087 length:396 start_codon:yes stop_codon:yes gene_type:complete
MASNIRFIDNLKVGSYQVQNGTNGNDTGSLSISNNINNYLLTSTGTNTINGESNLQFDGTNLSIGVPTGAARFEINDDSGADLMIIKNNVNTGIKVTNTGVFQLLEFSTLPTAVKGGLAYVSDDFYVGVDS